jgi:hypothetical protein
MMKRGNIVTNKGSGQSYVVIDDECGRIVAARIIEISNPSEWQQHQVRHVAEAVAAEAVEELNCHQRQDILDRKTRQYEKTCDLAERLLVAIAGTPVYRSERLPHEAARIAWIQAEAMIDFANEQKPEE